MQWSTIWWAIYTTCALHVFFVQGPECYRKALATNPIHPDQIRLATLFYSSWWRRVLSAVFWLPVAIVSAIWVFAIMLPRVKKDFDDKD